MAIPRPAPSKEPLYLDGQIEKNVVTLTALQNADGRRIDVTGVELRVYMNDKLADLDQPVKMVVNGKTVFDVKVQRKVVTLARSLNERRDPYCMFPVGIPVKL